MAGFVRLWHLVDLGLHQADDVGGDLPGGAGDQDQRGGQLHDPGLIARDLEPTSTQQLWIFDIYGFVLAACSSPWARWATG